MPESELLAEELTRLMAALHGRGWCDGTGGNFSCVLSHDPLTLLMAPSGVDKGTVRPEQLLQVNERAQVVAGEGRASAETRLHLEIVERTGAGAVLHTHSQSATLLSDWCLGQGSEAGSGQLLLQDLEMLKGLAGIDSHSHRVQLPVLANDQNMERLAQAAGPLLVGAPHGLLIGGHGLYAWGRDLSEARRHLEILEWLLEQRWRRLLLESLRQLAPWPAEGSRAVDSPGEASRRAIRSAIDPSGITRGEHRQELGPSGDITPAQNSGGGGVQPVEPVPVKAILLDIEGTTCPVSFVSQVLFPYARERLDRFLRRESRSPTMARLLEAIDRARTELEQAREGAASAKRTATDSGSIEERRASERILPAQQPREAGPPEDGQDEQVHQERVRFLQQLIDQDVKHPALKELQGLIWDEGYSDGELACPLFEDVAPALRRWRRQGKTLAVYSSGSVRAQQLLYRHSTEGDLSALFSHWYDTGTGAKNEPASYRAIARAMDLEPAAILFVSDAISELEAARHAGMSTWFSLRKGNPRKDPGPFPVATSLLQIPI